MSHSLRATRPAALLALALCAAPAACGSQFTLPPATLLTVEDTVTLYAISATPLAQPSAYDMVLQLKARTDRTSQLDFAFNIDSAGTGLLLPRGALGLYRDGGLQITAAPYDSIRLAPTGGYQDSVGVRVTAGTVVLAASRSQTCNYGYVRPLYAKLTITALDPVARSVRFRMLLDPNCGYRSLQLAGVLPGE